MFKDGMPVNVPYFWSVIKHAYDQEAAFINSGNILLNDLLDSVADEIKTIDVREIGVTRDSVLRLGRLAILQDIDSEDGIPDIDRAYLIDNQVMLKYIDPILGFTGAFDYYNNNSIDSVARITERYYNPEIVLLNDVDYICDVDTTSIRFSSSPIGTSYQKIPETLTGPSGAEYEIFRMTFFFHGVSRRDGPLYTDFGCLVYHRDKNSAEEVVDYRRKIVGLMNAFYHGATHTGIEAAVNTLFGLPVTLHNGEIIQKIDRTDPTLIVVVTDYETYVLDVTIPINEDILVMGGRLPVYTPFHTVIDIIEKTPPTTFSEHLVRVDPYVLHKDLDPTTIPELYSPALDTTTKHPFNLKYPHLVNYIAEAHVTADIDPTITFPAVGDYYLIAPATGNYIEVKYEPHLGGMTEQYVVGDIVYFDERSGKFERYRNILYKGTVSPDTVEQKRGEYHAFVIGGSLKIRDDMTNTLFSIAEMYSARPPEYVSTDEITFDMFPYRRLEIENKWHEGGKYYLTPDGVLVDAWNTVVWNELLRDIIITIRIKVPAGTTSEQVADTSFIDEIMPIWSVYDIEYIYL